jgi:hypothetical protein
MIANGSKLRRKSGVGGFWQNLTFGTAPGNGRIVPDLDHADESRSMREINAVAIPHPAG